MLNGEFNPTWSTDNIWREEDMERCLSNDLNTIEANIANLQTGKADIAHTHTEYAAASEVTALQTLVGDTSVASQISSSVATKADIDHTHSGYASLEHTHSYNDLNDKPTIPTSLPANGGNSDTVDGKHANEFASVADVTALQTLVGDTSVSAQIATQISSKADVSHTHDDRYYTESEVDNKLSEKVDAVAGKGLSTEDFTTAEKTKLANLSNTGGSITVDSSLSSTSKNPVQNKVINAALAGKANSNHTHSAATIIAAGFMSAADKSKLNGIATGANNYTLPTATSSVLGGVKTGSNITNSLGTISLTKSNVTSALGYTPLNSSSILSLAQGGTGTNQLGNAPANAILKMANLGNHFEYTQVKNGAYYATATNGVPKFGTLPIAQGGTGETTAWTNGTVTSLNNTTITSYQFAVFPYLNKAFIRLNVLLGSALAADDAKYIAMPSTVATAHTSLSCYNHNGYDIHCGMSSDSGIYVINCGTASMSTSVRLYIAGWFSI